MPDVHEKIRQIRSSRGLSQAEFASRLGFPKSKIQNIETGKQRLDHEFLHAVGVNFTVDLNELLMGGKIEPVDGDCNALFSPDATIQHLGFASCSVHGWGKPQPEPRDLPRPMAIDDPDAFYVTARGQSMTPEGIPAGAFCVVAPNREPKVNDRVWIEEGHGNVAIKRLLEIGEKSLKLRGWMPRADGQQQSFDEERMTNFIRKLYPVAAVYMGKPGNDNVKFIPDPREPKPHEPTIAQQPQVQSHSYIKLLGVQAAAGQGAYVDDERVVSSIAFPNDWLSENGISPDQASLVFARGSSMAPTINDGAMVLVDHKEQTPKRRQVYVYRNGEELFIKRLELLGNDTLIALSDNPEFDTLMISGNDLEQVSIIGRVIWSGGKVSGL